MDVSSRKGARRPTAHGRRPGQTASTELKPSVAASSSRLKDHGSPDPGIARLIPHSHSINQLTTFAVKLRPAKLKTKPISVNDLVDATAKESANDKQARQSASRRRARATKLVIRSVEVRHLRRTAGCEGSKQARSFGHPSASRIAAPSIR
jgi:hypothetical protein